MLFNRKFPVPTLAILAVLTLAVGCVSRPQANGEKLTLTSGSQPLDGHIASFFRGPLPVETILLVDVSGSARASGQLETLSAAVCKQAKEHIMTGDTVVFKPYAAKSTTTHRMQPKDRLGVMGLCNNKNFANHLFGTAITDDVASEDGTSLFRTMQNINAATDSDAAIGTVITLVIDADDQAVGAEKAVPLTETTQHMESLLVNNNTALVVFAIDGDLRRGLEASLQHPQARVSPLSEQSIENAMQWAYDIARSPLPTPAAAAPEAAQAAQ